jgi:hypothetical protein
LLALVQGQGLAEDDLRPEMGTPFSGGSAALIGRTAALSGAMLAVGAAHAVGLLSREATYGLAAQLVRDSGRAFGNALC